MKYQTLMVIALIALGLSVGNLIGSCYSLAMTADSFRIINERLQELEKAKSLADLPESEIRKSFGKRAPRSSVAYSDEERRILRLERDAALRELAEVKQ